MLIFGAQEYVDQRALVDFVVEPPPADQPLLRDWPLNLVWLHRPVTFSDTITRQFKGENPMHDSDPFRVPVREPKPGTFHRPAHGFGIKFEPRPTELKLSDRGLARG